MCVYEVRAEKSFHFVKARQSLWEGHPCIMGDDLQQLPVLNKAGFGSITKAMTEKETDY